MLKSRILSGVGVCTNFDSFLMTFIEFGFIINFKLILLRYVLNSLQLHIFFIHFILFLTKLRISLKII